MTKISSESGTSRSARHVPIGLPAPSRGARDAAALLDALRKVVRELRLAGRAAELRVGVHGAQLEVLQQLGDNDSVSLTELARCTSTDISSVSVVVSRLVELGLVHRRADPADRRRLVLGLTAHGRTVVRRAPETPRTKLSRATAGLPAREIRAMTAGLLALADELQADVLP